MVNNSVPRSTFNSLAAGFIPLSSSSSTPTSSADRAAILLSMVNVSQVAPSAASTTVVSPSSAPPIVLPDALVAVVAQAIGNSLPAIVSALHYGTSQPVGTAASSAPVSNSSGLAASSAPPLSSQAQAEVSGLASSAGRLQLPSFIPMFTPLPSTSSLSSLSLVASSMSPRFATGHSLPRAAASLAPPLSMMEKAFVVGPGHALVPYKLVARITSGQVVDLADLLSANLRSPEQEPQTYLEGKLIVSSSKRCLVEIKDILTWAEAFTIYQMVLCDIHPKCWPDLTKYKLLIIQTARQFPGQAWLEYDLAFCKDVAATGLSDWSKMTSDLYNFHLRSPTPLTTWQLLQPSSSSSSTSSPGQASSASMPFCHSWNLGRCAWPFGKCRYQYLCEQCRGEHARVNCPFPSITGQRSRSPSPASSGRWC